jgi:hypothetical protein
MVMPRVIVVMMVVVRMRMGHEISEEGRALGMLKSPNSPGPSRILLRRDIRLDLMGWMALRASLLV